MTVSTLAAALHYAAHGWHVFPCRLEAKSSHKCAKYSDGRPWGATKDPAEIRQDFARWPAARVGIVTGAISNIVVVDVDTIEGHGVDGSIALRELEAKHGPLPDTLRAMSPSGSTHHYLKHPGTGTKIKGSASELGAGIDVRADGNMTVAPPSINLDGRRYRWLNRNPISPLPAWLVELTREKLRASPTISERALAAIRRPTNGAISRSGNSDAYGLAALRYEIDALRAAPPGRRNAQLNRAKFCLQQLIDIGELDDEAEVDRELIAAATANGLVDDDGLKAVEATIESGKAGARAKPRSPR